MATPIPQTGFLVENLPLLLITGAVGLLLIPLYRTLFPSTAFPLINAPRGTLSWTKTRRHFQTNAKDLLREGQQKTDGPFSLITDRKIMTYLPPAYAEYIKNDHRFSFPEYASRDMMGHIPGFDPFGSLLMSGIANDVVQKRVTNNIDTLTGTLSNTANDALIKRWTDNPEWHEVHLQRSVLEMVAQLTSRIFVGEEVSSNPDWLDLSISYTMDAFLASKQLGRYPWWSRRIVHWFHPRCTRVRDSVSKAYKILAPVIKERQAERAANGGLSHHFDAIEWHSQVAGKRQYDEVVAQVGLALAAIHTTGDLLFKTLARLASHPTAIADARKEIRDVLATHGLNKAGIYQLRLVDSMVKETQRLDGVALVIMYRYVKEDATLPNGVTIPKGTQTAVITDIMKDEKTYANALEFDPYRFYNMRQAGQEHKGQLVSATPDHLAFGLGRHACPGRFFAAHEIKIMLAHILMKYDIEYVEGHQRGMKVIGTDVIADNSPRVRIRRREPEVDIPLFKGI